MTRRALSASGELTEAAFMAQVIGLARVYGWRIYHPPAGGHGSAKTGGRRVDHEQVPEGRGFPDLLLLKGGRLIVAELKTRTGRMRQDQQEWLDAFNQMGYAIDDLYGSADTAWPRAGVVANIWRPEDWDVIRRFLSQNSGSQDA
jgi:hypothetical protein